MPAIAAVAARSTPTEAQLLERARALTPVLRERAQRTEERRALLPETLQDFVEAGFYKSFSRRSTAATKCRP